MITRDPTLEADHAAEIDELAGAAVCARNEMGLWRSRS